MSGTGRVRARATVLKVQVRASEREREEEERTTNNQRRKGRGGLVVSWSCLVAAVRASERAVSAVYKSAAAVLVVPQCHCDCVEQKIKRGRKEREDAPYMERRVRRESEVRQQGTRRGLTRGTPMSRVDQRPQRETPSSAKVKKEKQLRISPSVSQPSTATDATWTCPRQFEEELDVWPE